MSLVGAWVVPGGFTVFCQLSLPGRRGPLGSCRALLASWLVGVGEPVGCLLASTWLLSASPLHRRGGEPSQHGWDKVVPSAVEFRPDGGITTKGLRSGF